MKKIKCLALILLCFILLSNTVSAASVQSTPYLGYEFNDDGVSVPAPVGYEVKDVAHDYNMSLNIDLGVPNKIVYDGINGERPFALVRTDKMLLKTDVNYNIVAYYSVPDLNSAKSFVLCPENGYIFAAKNGKVDVYNTNGKFVKSITSSQVGGNFNPTKIVRFGDNTESGIYVLSGNTIISLDNDGNYVETISLNTVPNDIYYNTSSMALYLLTNSSVIDFTNESTYSLGKNFTSASQFSVGSSGETFYILDNSATYVVDGAEEKTEIISESGCLSVDFNGENDKLNILSIDNELLVKVYDNTEFVKSVKGYNISMLNPADMLYDNENYLYVLDSGNGRIIKTDKECKVIYAIYESFIESNKKLSIVDAQGIWIDGSTLYIADTENERVIVTDFGGNVKKVILKPKSLSGLAAPFNATKVLTDRNGRIYVIAETVNLGAFVFSKDYEYQNFFGSNTVVTTAEAIYNYIVKQFLNKEQKAQLQSNTPVTLSNFDIDDKGFIYVVTKTDQKLINNTFTEHIRKINYIGSDILGDDENELVFGDIEWDREKQVTNTSFVDIDITEDGWVTALDGIRGKVFQYSPEGQFITSFGGIGEKYGFTNSPVAVETIGNEIYILDSYTDSIVVYKPTDYVHALHDAFTNMDTADLDTAIEKWNNVLNLNSNNTYAYYGLGIAYENAGDYESAMKNFKMANAKEQYSKAYKEYRKTYVSDNLIWIALVLITVITLLVLGIKKLSKQFVVPEDGVYAPIESKLGMPLYVLLHPADGFAQFRPRNINSTFISICIALAFFFIRILEFFNTGFIFNENRPINYSLFSTLLGTLVIYVLFIFSNLAIASFMDGKGTLKQIMALLSYSMVPYLVAILLNILLSNFLALDEQIFMSIILLIGALWSIVVLIMGSIQIHEYSFGKTVLSLVLSVVAMLVFAVLGVLLFTLVQELFSFIKAVIYELSLR